MIILVVVKLKAPICQILQNFPDQRDVEQLRGPAGVQQLQQPHPPRESLPRCAHETRQPGGIFMKLEGIPFFTTSYIGLMTIFSGSIAI